MSIQQVEDEILTKVTGTLPGVLKASGTLPGNWSLDLLKRLLQKSPAVYVTFLGGNQNSQSDLAMIGAKFDVYIVSKGADEETRRRGNTRVIGGYEMIERLAPVLNGLTIPGIGSLELKSVKNLFAGAMLDIGGTVYALTFELPRLVFEKQLNPDGLGQFITFHAESDFNSDGTPDITNQFDLPQE